MFMNLFVLENENSTNNNLKNVVIHLFMCLVL